ncbi:uncharacterized protein V1516DRAFT_687598 [Lipomyces oligophaga]|uniref:uncharacterized protein n=1 Tax=Lipomyces oligophaga TaxID=45792 RepID=UPI0034CDD649
MRFQTWFCKTLVPECGVDSLTSDQPTKNDREESKSIPDYAVLVESGSKYMKRSTLRSNLRKLKQCLLLRRRKHGMSKVIVNRLHLPNIIHMIYNESEILPTEVTDKFGKWVESTRTSVIIKPLGFKARAKLLLHKVFQHRLDSPCQSESDFESQKDMKVDFRSAIQFTVDRMLRDIEEQFRSNEKLLIEADSTDSLDSSVDISTQLSQQTQDIDNGKLVLTDSDTAVSQDDEWGDWAAPEQTEIKSPA